MMTKVSIREISKNHNTRNRDCQLARAGEAVTIPCVAHLTPLTGERPWNGSPSTGRHAAGTACQTDNDNIKPYTTLEREKTMLTKSPLFALLALLPTLFLSAPAAQAEGMTIADTVYKVQLEDGVSMDDAVESMKLRANALNFKMVAHQPLSKELEGMGIETKRVEIFQFCDARIAHTMISQNLDFSAYLPCRITLIEDQEGQPWLVTMDLDRVIQVANLPPELLENATKVRDTIKEIMEAGATGDL